MILDTFTLWKEYVCGVPSVPSRSCKSPVAMLQVHIYDVFVMPVFIKAITHLKKKTTRQNGKGILPYVVVFLFCVCCVCVLFFVFVCLFVCFLICVYGLIFGFFSRQEFSICPWLSWNSLCRPCWPCTQKSAYVCLPSAGIKAVHHQHPANIAIFSEIFLMFFY